jgi:hypothetical protein
MIRHATDCKVRKLIITECVGSTTEVWGWHVSYAQPPNFENSQNITSDSVCAYMAWAVYRIIAWAYLDFH